MFKANVFRFSNVNPNEVMRQIDLLDKTKSNSGNLPTGMLKTTNSIVCQYVTDCINFTIHECKHTWYSGNISNRSIQSLCLSSS